MEDEEDNDTPSASAPAAHAQRRLRERLEAIAAVLAAREDTLALLALGSLAAGESRVDEHSDLDFFVLVRDGAKPRYTDDLGWLAAAHPLAWHFRNTVDGCKALMGDGVFCEFAVFELRELASIPHAPGRFAWRRDEVDPALARPVRALPGRSDPAWLAGEVLANLLIGLHRSARGERLAAMRLVQVQALDRLLELREQTDAREAPTERDAFAVDRRVEQRLPTLTDALPAMASGYHATPQAALRILAALQAVHPVAEPIGAEIRALAASGPAPGRLTRAW
jgi:lincosamide nucleotidyltransferase B/F